MNMNVSFIIISVASTPLPSLYFLHILTIFYSSSHYSARAYLNQDSTRVNFAPNEAVR